MDINGDEMLQYIKWILHCLYLYWSVEDQYIHKQMTLKGNKSIYPKRPQQLKR